MDAQKRYMKTHSTRLLSVSRVAMGLLRYPAPDAGIEGSGSNPPAGAGEEVLLPEVVGVPDEVFAWTCREDEHLLKRHLGGHRYKPPNSDEPPCTSVHSHAYQWVLVSVHCMEQSSLPSSWLGAFPTTCSFLDCGREYSGST